MIFSRHSIRFRLALIVAFVMASLGVVAGFGSHAWLRRSLESEVQSFAGLEAEEVVNIVAPLKDAQAVRTNQVLLKALYPEEGVDGLAVWSPSGELVFRLPAEGARSLPLWDEGLKEMHESGLAFRRLRGVAPTPDTIAAMMRVERDGQLRWIVTTGVTLTRVEEALKDYARYYAVGMTVLVLIAFAGSMVLLSYGLRPVAALVEDTRLLCAGGLDRRLSRPPPGSELRELVDLLNSLLDQTVESMGTLRRFASHTGHELRTPLTRIRVAAEEALIRPEPERSSEALALTLEEIDGMRSVLDSLLELSYGDAPDPAVGGEVFSLGALVEEVVEEAGPIAAEASTALACSAKADPTVRGSRVLVLRVLWNLVDNAMRFAAGGEVVVTTETQAGWAVVTIKDDGPGLPAEDLERVFAPFETGETGPTGQGLGLPLARTIARRHGGDLVAIESADAGAQFRLSLPLGGVGGGEPAEVSSTGQPSGRP